MGYSAWGTAANSVGIALSMGLTRLQWLQGEQDPQPEDSEAFARELIFAYMKDIAYCRYCRPTIKDLTPEGIEQALLGQNMTTRRRDGPEGHGACDRAGRRDGLCDPGIPSDGLLRTAWTKL